MITVARVVGVPYPADLWIFEADDMLEQQRFGLAVLAAQVHVEMTVRARIEELARPVGGDLAELVPSIPRSWSLMDPTGQAIFHALTGQRPTAADCWELYRAHIARRNSVVHRGADVTAEGASQSVDAAVNFVRFVDAATDDARKHGPREGG